MEENPRNAEAKHEEKRETYEPPKLEALGTMLELTEGMGAFTLDLGGLSHSSDRAVKENFGGVDPEEVLDAIRALDVQTWNYKADDASVRHIGPMAQDFAAAFGVGEDDRKIMNVDAQGVCLAAIQALATRIEALETEIATLRAAELV
jgi:hypothetical protein